MSWFQRQVAAVALAQFREERLRQRVLIGQRWGQLQQQAAEPGAQLGNFAEKALQFLRAISQALSWLISRGSFTQKLNPSGTLAAHLR